jgi:putative MATE family efflux protein
MLKSAESAKREARDPSFMRTRPVFPLLVSMAFPMVISMAVNALYNIVDSYFVAKISGDAMTALSLVFPIQNFISAMAIGFGVGVNAAIAWFLGAGQRENADRAASQGILLSALHGLALTVLSLLFIGPFLRMYTESTSVLGYGLSYARIVFCFSVVVNVSITWEKIFQAVGRMQVSMAAMMAGCLTNLILDPCMIFGLGPFPAWGIRGAAVATGIGQMVSLAWYLAVYVFRPIPVRVRRGMSGPEAAMAKRLYSVGIPATLNLALPSVMISVMNGILSAWSETYVMVLGIYYKLQTFLYLTANGIIQGMRPLIGYNYGAREYGRVRKIFCQVLLMCAVIMAFGTGVCLGIPDRLIGLFSRDPGTVAAGAEALRVICAGFVVSAVSITCSGALEGLGKGMPSLVISLCRYILIILPAAWIFSRFLGPVGVWHAFWAAELSSAVVAVLVFRRAVRLPEKDGKIS